MRRHLKVVQLILVVIRFEQCVSKNSEKHNVKTKAKDFFKTSSSSIMFAW